MVCREGKGQKKERLGETPWQVMAYLCQRASLDCVVCSMCWSDALVWFATAAPLTHFRCWRSQIHQSPRYPAKIHPLPILALIIIILTTLHNRVVIQDYNFNFNCLLSPPN